jgi:hypothetical protein
VAADALRASNGKPVALVLGSGIHGDRRALDHSYWWPYVALAAAFPLRANCLRWPCQKGMLRCVTHSSSRAPIARIPFRATGARPAEPTVLAWHAVRCTRYVTSFLQLCVQGVFVPVWLSTHPRTTKIPAEHHNSQSNFRVREFNAAMERSFALFNAGVSTQPVWNVLDTYSLVLSALNQCPKLQAVDGTHLGRCVNTLKLHSLFNLLYRALPSGLGAAQHPDCLPEMISEESRALLCRATADDQVHWLPFDQPQTPDLPSGPR